MQEGLRHKLEQITDRHEELAAMLCEPEVVNDKARFLESSREHADLDPVATAFREFLKVEEDLEGARELLEDPDMKEMAQEDVRELEGTLGELEVRLQKLLIPKDPNDGKNVILEIRAGAGGDEAGIFAGDLWRMYGRYAERRGWTIEPMGFSEASSGGFKEVSGLVKGKEVYGILKFESGVHRVQRVPATESQGRIHTSTAAVAIMPEAEDVDIKIDPKDLRIDVMRSSGAGGQHVNTTDSAVRITHEPTGIVVQCQSQRSQHKNRAAAWDMLRARLYEMELQKREEEANAEAATKTDIGWGHQIRSYVLQPYQMVKDLRTQVESPSPDAVLDGDLDRFMAAALAQRVAGEE
jgi:peptide chain release factor 1